MSPVVYIKNLLVVPHTDFTVARGFLFSAGADFTVELANFLWFPFDCSVGFSLDYSGGTRWGELPFIFSMDI